MLTAHVSKDLSAFVQHELEASRASRVAEHLERCHRCRAELEVTRRGIDIASRVLTARVPSTVWPAILRAREQAPRRWKRPRWLAPAAVTCGLLIAIGAISVWSVLSPASEWPVASLGGSTEIGALTLVDRGTLSEGDRLRTAEGSRATIRIGRIGQVEVEPGSSVRLISTGVFDHRLALERGAIKATIFAPPRVFSVETPSATAVDLGCAYSLSVDERGDSMLSVTSGWVALEAPPRRVFVPAGASCRTVRGIGPGTPYFADADPALREAVEAIDRAGGNASRTAVVRVISSSRPRDTLTLWHLIERVGAGDRALVYERLATFSPPPSGITRERVLALDPAALDRWRQTLNPPWKAESVWHAAWRRFWMLTLDR